MIIVDTFVWIDHINASERVLAASLRCHLHPIRNLQFVDLHGARCGNELPEFRGCLGVCRGPTRSSTLALPSMFIGAGAY
jgi:hypothetical protein